MASHIQNLVAVATTGANTVLFQVDKDYNLCFYESSNPDESEAEVYNFRTLKINNSEVVKVNKDQPVIAAVAFTHQSCCKGEAQIRVYYVSRDDHVIQELQRSGDSRAKWQRGDTFNNQGISIAENSGLTANVYKLDDNNHQIKIYYQQSNKDDYADVIYNVIGTKVWAPRANVTKA